jgi:hypothetical protein
MDYKPAFTRIALAAAAPPASLREAARRDPSLAAGLEYACAGPCDAQAETPLMRNIFLGPSPAEALRWYGSPGWRVLADIADKAPPAAARQAATELGVVGPRVAPFALEPLLRLQDRARKEGWEGDELASVVAAVESVQGAQVGYGRVRHPEAEDR